MRPLIFTFFVFTASFLNGSVAIFHPPEGWECAFPENLSSCVQIGFLGKGSGQFRPSLNLATEEVDVGLRQYIKAVKEIHTAEPGTGWRDLGAFKSLAGKGRLTEISTSSPMGDVKMLQMIVVLKKTAYIMTGAALKDDFLRLQEVFLKAFQSLSLEKNLFSPLTAKKQAEFETFFTALSAGAADEAEKEKKWKSLQSLVLKEDSMGDYWRFLVLKEGRERIYSPE